MSSRSTSGWCTRAWGRAAYFWILPASRACSAAIIESSEYGRPRIGRQVRVALRASPLEPGDRLISFVHYAEYRPLDDLTILRPKAVEVGNDKLCSQYFYAVRCQAEVALRVLKRSERKGPRLSLILLDWSVRESFHLFHYLKSQTVPRDSFEVVLIEYYDCVSGAAKRFEDVVDTWILLQMPRECYYHKHLMYNAGVVASQGEILMFGDSDAMVRPAFVETIFKAFSRDPLIVYHMDEFRNIRRDLYPFNYPSFEEVIGDGCINHVNGMTLGIRDEIDPMHTRNYGACMCARRQDILAIGGADEDLTYLGHICGPYDMTFRLMNLGRRLEWENQEYLYHTWHPGSDGIDNYLGPHDGRNMSTTAFQALCSGRIKPLVENEAIRRLRVGSESGDDGASPLDLLISPDSVSAFNRKKLREPVRQASYGGFDVYQIAGAFYAVPPQMERPDVESLEWRNDERVLRAGSFGEIRDVLDALQPRLIEVIGSNNICAVGKRFAIVAHALGPIDLSVQANREHPQIVWAETLEHARNAAGQRDGIERNEMPPPASPTAPPMPALRRADRFATDATQIAWEVADLERRLADMESRVSGIYESRTWRALTRVGGLLQHAIKVRRGKSGRT